ncbi:dihydrolipoyl dehydrogenase [Oxalobacteraceae bacterium R-40]|uniref:Dihydrolipoyl dehydrogenase n=1 Tax=Keguizhuia sedimenti TaxID=3064264 RepID=A0ABU1BKJ2_9BURK|nr:dihydrolipoyl dehydrogenase [Oxalobacteraceae bacterium R-40]
MNQMTVDVAVIGAGSAGLTAYRAAKAHDVRAVLIERGPYGTTCARVGCMPSKLLIAAAEAAHGIEHARGFGIHAANVHVDGAAVMARVKTERDRFAGFVIDYVDQLSSEDRIRGHAKFIDSHRLQVDDHTVIDARSVVIATGSSPSVPQELRGLGDRLLTSDAVFDWDTLPQSIAVIGTGAIGLELGQALHRLGARVTLFGRSKMLAQIDDPGVLAVARTCLADELDLRLESSILSAERDGNAVRVHSRSRDGTERTEHFEFILAATGRKPNIQHLGLERTGIELHENGLPVFDPLTMQCGESAIFIAGDANNERPLLHEATDQGRIAGSNAARYPHVQPGLRHIPFSIAFTDPQIALLGQSYKSLQKGRFVIGSTSFDDQGRSRVMLKNKGVLHVYAETGSSRFIGAAMIAPHAEHLAHLLAWACQSRMTIPQMLELPFYHPVIEEGLRSALRDAKEKLMRGIPEIEHCADCTPGT